MTESAGDTRKIQDGTDVSAEPDELEVDDLPATSDPESFDDDHQLGGVGGESPGGAG